MVILPKATLIRTQTKLPIPVDLLKKHTLQLDDELLKKAIQAPKPPPDESSDTSKNSTVKRPRRSDGDAIPAMSKRVKSEVCLDPFMYCSVLNDFSLSPLLFLLAKEDLVNLHNNHQ